LVPVLEELALHVQRILGRTKYFPGLSNFVENFIIWRRAYLNLLEQLGHLKKSVVKSF
jgi:hypothetical protein